MDGLLRGLRRHAYLACLLLVAGACGSRSGIPDRPRAPSNDAGARPVASDGGKDDALAGTHGDASAPSASNLDGGQSTTSVLVDGGPNAACARARWDGCDTRYYVCCGLACVDPWNDPHNCGACDTVCADRTICQGGECAPWPTCHIDCTADGGDATSCCGFSCCAPGQLCCAGALAPSGGYQFGCAAPNEYGTCPRGGNHCSRCVCASSGTPIATPDGDRRISDLKSGDVVFSVDRDAVVAVRLLRVTRAPVPVGHRMMRVSFANGIALEMSGGHPTADGRTLSDLRPGDELGGVSVIAVEDVPYSDDATWDILPASQSGAYFAGGVLVGSTLAAGAR